MAQEFYPDIPTGQTSVKQDNINSRKNELTLKSNFSGTSFPDNPAIGQHCYREDMNGKEFVYTISGWQEATDLSTIGQDVIKARGGFSSLTDKLKISIDDDGSLKNPTTSNVSEWKTMAIAPNYVSGTQFWLEGDVTPIFTQERGIKCALGLQTVFSSVSSSNYDSVNNKTFVDLKDSVLTNALNSVEYGIIQYSLGSIATKTDVNNAVLAHNTSATAHEDIRTSITEATQKAGLPLGFETFTFSPTVATGWLPYRGGLYSRELYAELFAEMEKQGRIISEEAWQAKSTAQNGNVAEYSYGDGSTTFRVPCVKCYVRGGSSIGDFLENQNREHNHASIVDPISGKSLLAVYEVSSGAGEEDNANISRNNNGNITNYHHKLKNSSLANQGGEEARPDTLVGTWIVKAYGTAQNIGSVDVSTMLQGIEQVQSRLSEVENNSDFIIIYPNNGSKTSPANVTVNSRYECDNPFSGYFVNCVAEIQVNGKWGSVQGTVRDGNGNYIGFACCQYGNSGEKIVLQTAQNYLCVSSVGDGSPFGSVNITTTPCRIKVWKIGKVIS